MALEDKHSHNLIARSQLKNGCKKHDYCYTIIAKNNLVTQIMMDPRMDEPRYQMVFLLWGGKVLL